MAINAKLSPQKVNISDIQNRCPHHIDKQTVYENYKNMGIVYGNYFQGITELWAGEGEALSKIDLPEPFIHELSTHTLHPTIADSALQTIAGITSLS